MGPDELAERIRQRFPEVLEARGEVTVTVTTQEPRFWIAYHLQSLERAHRVRVKVGLSGDDPHVPTVTPMFPTANWHEREVFDFFGVVFDGHPDLRRIEMPEGWVGHPLRKDHPLSGVNIQYKGAFIPPPDERGL